MYKKFQINEQLQPIITRIVNTSYTIKMIVLGIVLFQAMLSYVLAYDRIAVLLNA